MVLVLNVYSVYRQIVQKVYIRNKCCTFHSGDIDYFKSMLFRILDSIGCSAATPCQVADADAAVVH